MRISPNASVALLLLAVVLTCTVLWAVTDALLLLLGAISAGVGVVLAALR